MKEILLIGLLFIASMLGNTVVAKYSTNKVLGIDISYMRSGFIVLARFMASLLAGFACGYALKVGFGIEQVEHKNFQILGMVAIASLSFLVYWLLLGKLTKSKISLWGMTKTFLTETTIMGAVAVILAIILSTFFVVFIKP